MFLKALKYTGGLAAAVVLGAVEGAEQESEQRVNFRSDSSGDIKVNRRDGERGKKPFGEIYERKFS